MTQRGSQLNPPSFKMSITDQKAKIQIPKQQIRPKGENREDKKQPRLQYFPEG